MELTIGMKGTVSTLAERQDTALEVGSGDLLVYATPANAAGMGIRRAGVSAPRGRWRLIKAGFPGRFWTGLT